MIHYLICSFDRESYHLPRRVWIEFLFFLVRNDELDFMTLGLQYFVSTSQRLVLSF
jgi:hypothetical protein